MLVTATTDAQASTSPLPQVPENAPLDGLLRMARRHFDVATACFMGTAPGHGPYVSSDDAAGATALQGLSAQAWGEVAASAPCFATDTDTANPLRDHPLVAGPPRARFCAIAAVIDLAGKRLGTLVLLDREPRAHGEREQAFLDDLATALAVFATPPRRPEESERLYGLAIAGSGTGVWDRNVATGEIHYSTGWKAMLGYAEHEVTNRIEDSYTRLHPDDAAYVKAAMQAHFEHKTEHYEVEHRIRCRDGSWKWICSRGKVVARDAEGNALRMIGTTTDITRMRSMADTLRETVELVTNLTNEVPGLVFQYRSFTDGRALFPYASAGIADIYELDPESVAASAAPVEARVHEDDLERYRTSFAMSAARLSSWHLEYRVVLPRQGLRWRQGDARPQRLADGSTLWHGFITDVTERKRIEAELQEFATLDGLTQLPNRRHFMAQLDATLERVRRGEQPAAAVLMCDLDHFKSINDAWGHAAGDRALVQFARILRDVLRHDDLAGRVGGEEFAVLLCGVDAERAIAVAARVHQRVADLPLIEGEHRIPITVSIGVTAMTAADASAESALQRSDRALYRAKHNGRNRTECL